MTDDRFAFETQFYNAPDDHYCGLDEVGRGPLAGPVVAACVIVPPDARGMDFWKDVRDSKKIAEKKREKLFDIIMEYCHCGIAACTIEEIDTLNIHHASYLAMERAYAACLQDNNLSAPPCALVDGKFLPKLPVAMHPIIKGDHVSKTIGAASILAKVTRDRHMIALHEKYPHYDWHSNKGYGTAAHLAGIEKVGITEHHRKSFAPIKNKITQYS